MTGLVRWFAEVLVATVHHVARLPSSKPPYQVRTGSRSVARDSPGLATALGLLGKRIKELRKLRDLTQEQAAERAKLDEKHWQDLEAGRSNATVATLIAVGKALGAKLRELFED